MSLKGNCLNKGAHTHSLWPCINYLFTMGKKIRGVRQVTCNCNGNGKYEGSMCELMQMNNKTS